MAMSLRLSHELLEDGLLRLLHLQHEGVIFVGAPQHDDPGARAHAAHAHDLVCHVDGRVARYQSTPVGRKRPLVLREDGRDEAFGSLVFEHPLKVGRGGGAIEVRSEVAQGYDERGIADDAQFAVDHLCKLADGTCTVLVLGLLEQFCGCLLRGFVGLDQVLHGVDVHMTVPDVEVAHLGESQHGFAIPPHALAHGGLSLLLGEPVVASADLDARRQALDVPLPRSDGGLVEVVDVEDGAALGAEEEPEVGYVRVAACLDLDSGGRGAREVGRHDERASAIEGEGRDGHPLVAQRKQLPYAGLALAAQELDGIGTILWFLPSGVRTKGDLISQGGATLRAFLGTLPIGFAENALQMPADRRCDAFAHPHIVRSLPSAARTEEESLSVIRAVRPVPQHCGGHAP